MSENAPFDNDSARGKPLNQNGKGCENTCISASIKSPSPASDADELHRYSPAIEDADGLPQAMRMVIQSRGSYGALESLYTFINKWGKAQRKHAARLALAASTRTASDTRTAAGEAASQDAMRSIFFRDAKGNRVLLNVLGVYPTFSGIEIEVHSHFALAIEEELASRGAAQGRITCKTCNGHGSVGYPPDDYFDCPDCTPAATTRPAEVDVEAERKLFEAEASAARFFPAELWFGRAKSPSGRDEYENSHLQSRWEGWLAARTQADAGKAEPVAKQLAHGHREDYFLMANARRVAQHPIHMIRTMPNWALASELFATGSTSGHQICIDAGIDPDGYKIERHPPTTKPENT